LVLASDDRLKLILVVFVAACGCGNRQMAESIDLMAPVQQKLVGRAAPAGVRGIAIEPKRGVAGLRHRGSRDER